MKDFVEKRFSTRREKNHWQEPLKMEEKNGFPQPENQLFTSKNKLLKTTFLYF